MFLGSYAIDDTLTFYANSHTPSTGGVVDADAVPGYRIYEDETGTPLLTGSMALLDDTNTVGFYSEQVTLSAANGFELGKSYCVRVTLVVGGVTGALLHQFQLGSKVDVRMVGGSTQSATDLKDFADDGYDPATNKVQGVATVDTVTTVNSLAANAITAASIATDAIDSDAIAASAVTEIQAGLATAAALATVQADTDDIQTRLPAALVGGRMDSSVGAIAANAITAASIATDAIDSDAIAASAVTEIQAGLATAAALATVQADTDDIQTRLPAALVGGRMDSSVGAMATDVVNANALASDAVDELVDGVWDEAIGGHLSAGSAGEALEAAGTAGDPWTTLLPGPYSPGTAGHIVGTNLDAPVSAVALQTTVDNLPTSAEMTVLVNTEVVDALSVDTYPEPTSVPAATASVVDKIGWMAVVARNRILQTDALQRIRNDVDSGDIGTATVSDDGTTAIRGEFT